MSKIWFTADTHFSHERTLELSRRPFKNTTEMNEVMIKNWNSVVGDDDVVYHLGDFGDYSIRKLLNGYIVLLAGNYEVDDFNSRLDLLNDLTELYGFEEIITIKSFKKYFDKDEYNLVHEPSNSTEDCFKLFGHIHKLQMVKRNGLNVGVDCHHFTPISLDEVKFYRNAIKNFYDEEVFNY